MSIQWTENSVTAVIMKLLMISLILKTFSDKVAIITVIWLKIFEMNNH